MLNREMSMMVLPRSGTWKGAFHGSKVRSKSTSDVGRCHLLLGVLGIQAMTAASYILSHYTGVRTSLSACSSLVRGITVHRSSRWGDNSSSKSRRRRGLGPACEGPKRRRQTRFVSPCLLTHLSDTRLLASAQNSPPRKKRMS
ncbi:hypothetical protein BU23DRAFT_319712 [Bimuria novae-zelandiae CBS 107.79]|uniref:Uncharacterized protein n=1 Tax=Bimuria novae-zelandiae CBS 107.79 TaxID=1447943 RepID=A0A6A5VIN1_9PLEO|nr:hypothetical protein BU23DRAFT_319712 [Bimuria novae-zelandiae CBS 107.79]